MAALLPPPVPLHCCLTGLTNENKTSHKSRHWKVDSRGLFVLALNSRWLRNLKKEEFYKLSWKVYWNGFYHFDQLASEVFHLLHHSHPLNWKKLEIIKIEMMSGLSSYLLTTMVGFMTIFSALLVFLIAICEASAHHSSDLPSSTLKKIVKPTLPFPSLGIIIQITYYNLGLCK